MTSLLQPSSDREVKRMIELTVVGMILYLICAYILSFAFCERGHPRISWFFIATFWLLMGHILTAYFSIQLLIVVIIVGLTTAVLVGGERRDES